MAKLSRTALKSVVKECLLEILSEGLADGVNELMESRASQPKPRKKKRQPRSEPEPNRNAAFDETVERTVSSMTDDSLLAEMLADTARGTLQEQLAHDGKNQGLVDPGATSGDVIDPTDIFGKDNQASDHWATLAFSDGRPK